MTNISHSTLLQDALKDGNSIKQYSSHKNGYHPLWSYPVAGKKVSKYLLSVLICREHCESHLEYIKGPKIQISPSLILSLIRGYLLSYRAENSEHHVTEEANEARVKGIF